jgi:hypothetical protein
MVCSADNLPGQMEARDGGESQPMDASARRGPIPEGHASCTRARAEEKDMLLAIAIILFIAWALGFLAFHVAGGLIHLLIVLAVISLVVHLFRRPSVV